MEISGKVIAVLPIQSGEGKNGPWRSMDFVIETQDQYPKKICVNLFGSRIDQFPVAVDDQVTVHFDIESREWNSRWFTTIRAWKIEKSVTKTPDNDDATLLPPIPPAFDPNATDDGSALPF